MAISVIMPALGMAQETGKLVAWRKQEGETIVKGEPLLEIETDKVIVELEAPGDGILAGVRARSGMEVPVGETIAWIVNPGETPPENVPIVRALTMTATSVPPPMTGRAAAELKISPKARRLARERGVDLGIVRGSGPDGEILASDVLAAQPSVVEALPTVEVSSAIGRLMAERTAKSWTSVPHFFMVQEIDAGELIKERATDASVTHTDILIALVARVLERHPRLNASWSGDCVRLNVAVNIAVAVAVSEGVVAPVIHDAVQKTLSEVAARRRELTGRAKAGRLEPADLIGGTFTISNLGMFGVDSFSAIVSPPQAAILAVGAIADRVLAVDGSPTVRPTIILTLSSDHRVVDGARAASFLRDLTEAIRHPSPFLRP